MSRTMFLVLIENVWIFSFCLQFIFTQVTDMKHFLRLLLTFVLFKANLASKIYKVAFEEITKVLAATNHEVLVMSVNGSSDFINFAVLKIFGEKNVPHKVVAFKNVDSPEYQGINTSAVIGFDSFKSLENFNNE